MVATAGFLELGLDSLFLTQASNAIQKEFGAKIPIRALLEDCSTLATLAARLDTLLPDDAAPPAPAAAPAPVAAPAAVTAQLAVTPVVDGLSAAVRANTAAAPSLEMAGVFAQQLAIIARQLEILGGTAAGAVDAAPMQAVSNASPQNADAATVGTAAIDRGAGASPPPVAAAPVAAFGPYRPPARALPGEITALQERNLKEFIESYNRKTAGSKRATAANRAHLADPRSVAGFRLAWKEMVYPIVSVRSEGSRIWDIDGNEYVDLVTASA